MGLLIDRGKTDWMVGSTGIPHPFGPDAQGEAIGSDREAHAPD